VASSGHEAQGQAAPARFAGAGRLERRRRPARDDDLDEDMDFGEEVDAEAGEPKAAKEADAEESDIADPEETKDLVRQRAMRVTAEEEEPEALDELAADALAATHEDVAAEPSAKLHAPPGTTKPQAKRGAPPAEPRRSEAPPPGGDGVARSLAAKALEVAAKVLSPAAKAPPRPPLAKARAAPARKPATKPAAKAKPAAKKAVARKPAAKKAAAKKPAGKGKR
jgi:hypothetical protein